MKGRFRQIEAAQAAARQRIPAAALETYAPLRKELSALTRAAATRGISDATLLRRIQALADRAPHLLKKIDPGHIADALEEHTARALLSGILSREEKK